MHITCRHLKYIFFMASLTLSYSRHISLDIENIIRVLPKKESCERVCMTPGCVKTATRIILSLDETVDPCKDFYQFACGGWLNNHVIPEGKDQLGLFEEVIEELYLKVKTLFEKELDGTEPAFVKMLKDFYDTCMDLEAIDNLGSEPLKKDLESLGGWPVVEGSQWNESSFDWVDTSIAFRRLGYDGMIINPSVSPNGPKRKTNMIIVGRSRLSYIFYILNRGLNDSEIAAHYKMGVKEAVLLGADATTAEKELLEALEFEIEIAKIYITRVEEMDENEVQTAGELKQIIPERRSKRRVRRDISRMYSEYTVAELQKMVPEIPWLRLFNGLMNDEIGETEIVDVPDPVFLKKLAKLLEKTEKRVVANYMFWRMVDSMKSHLSKEWREVDANHKYQDRVDTCIDESYKNLKIALNSYYTRQYFKEETKHAVMELVKYIHRELLRIIEGSDWMDDETKTEAIEKANSMKFEIAYPNELLNDSAITDIYEKLTVSNNSYYKNVMNIQKWEKDAEYSSRGKPSISSWKVYAEAILVNGHYHTVSNTIELPAGILQNFFFEKDRPHYVNFATIGYIIGHEITHGFDTDGKNYDKEGNKVDWWDKTTNELYHKRAQCMIEQYSNYTLESGIKINGKRTQAENIADNGGLKEAYRAYHTWVKDHGLEPLLPGLKYTQNQLFWISAAKVWCTKYSLKELEKIILDSHSPDKFRVIGPMSNLPEFSRDFNCPPDSPMNRKNKCHVW